jgi:hypothetical protein
MSRTKRQLIAARRAIRRWRAAFRAWREENARMHAASTPSPCCSRPPPGKRAAKK